MNPTTMVESLQAMWEEWLWDRGIEPLGVDEPDWRGEHDREWIRFKAALDQALAEIDTTAAP